MSARAANWLTACGGVGMFIALCLIPAMVRDRNDVSLIGVGASLFSFGTLLMASGIYLKARMLQSIAPAPVVRRSRGGCDLCRGEAPVIHCKVHQLHLCPACMAEHYDFRSCAYVPSTRARTGKGAARAHSA